jgi:hypothetical protein
MVIIGSGGDVLTGGRRRGRKGRGRVVHRVKRLRHISRTTTRKSGRGRRRRLRGKGLWEFIKHPKFY